LGHGKFGSRETTLSSIVAALPLILGDKTSVKRLGFKLIDFAIPNEWLFFSFLTSLAELFSGLAWASFLWSSFCAALEPLCTVLFFYFNKIYSGGVSPAVLMDKKRDTVIN